MSDCDLCASLRPGQSQAGLLLHRHLLPQQHLCVRVLLLPTRMTDASAQLTSVTREIRENKAVFLAHAHTKRKKRRMQHKNENKL